MRGALGFVGFLSVAVFLAGSASTVGADASFLTAAVSGLDFTFAFGFSFTLSVVATISTFFSTLASATFVSITACLTGALVSAFSSTTGVVSCFSLAEFSAGIVLLASSRGLRSRLPPRPRLFPRGCWLFDFSKVSFLTAATSGFFVLSFSLRG